jgi:glucose-1-phosphate thymidylyltransferase
MIAAGATQICIVISPEKSDMIRYYAERSYAAEIFYVVQQSPRGLCDALFRGEPFAEGHDQVLIGLPDTVWFPENAYLTALSQQRADVNLILFPVENPSMFDAVTCDPQNFALNIEGKVANPRSHWVWGAITATSEAFRCLKLLWEARHREDEYMSTLLNAYIDAGNAVRGHPTGETYIDVGTMQGFRRAQEFLQAQVRPQIFQKPAA